MDEENLFHNSYADHPSYTALQKNYEEMRVSRKDELFSHEYCEDDPERDARDREELENDPDW